MTPPLIEAVLSQSPLLVTVGEIVAGVAAGGLLGFSVCSRRGRSKLARLNGEIAAREAQLRSVIDASPYALFWKDAGGRYLGCNPAFPAYVGRDDPAGVVGNTDLDFGMAPDDAEQYRACDRRIVETGEPLLNHAEQIDLRGDRRDLLTNKVPLRGPGGAVEGTVGVFVDVTDRVRAERRLEESMMELADSHAEIEKLSLLASHSRHAVLVNGPDTRIEWVNPAFTRMTGYPADEAVGRTPDFLIGDGTDPATLARIDAALAARRPVCEEVLQYRRDGSTYWIELEIDPVFDDSGEVVRLVATQTDISERRAAEAQRRTDLAEIEKLGLVARATRHSVIIADARGRAEWVNDAFTALTQYTLDDVRGKKPGEVLQGPDTCPETKRRIGERLRRGESVCEEIVNYCKAGIGYPIRLEIEPVRRPGADPGDRDAIVNFVAIQVDLREQKAQEAALREAKEAAEAANRTKSAFLANMSHEIRTPLNGILGFADVLRGGGTDEAQTAEYLDTIRSSGDHLLGLINDILDLSKVEAGRMEFEPVRCDPHAILCDVLSVLRVGAAGRGLSLECRWGGEVPETVLTDPGRLRQVLTNVVGNAVKFTAAGSVRVFAAVERDAAAGSSQLVVEVHDTGEGIAADKLETIFEPFAQADASVTRRHGGTGLGLAICRKIAEALGGSLTVTSRVGWGSVFKLTVDAGDPAGVPVHDPAPDEAVRGDAAATPGDGPARLTAAAGVDPVGDLSGLRVLLVEDGEVNRKLIGVVLRRAGVAPVEAHDGRAGADAALAAAAAGDPFDVILMDMQMPVLDGYAAAAELRAAGLSVRGGADADPGPHRPRDGRRPGPVRGGGVFGLPVQAGPPGGPAGEARRRERRPPRRRSRGFGKPGAGAVRPDGGGRRPAGVGRGVRRRPAGPVGGVPGGPRGRRPGRAGGGGPPLGGDRRDAGLRGVHRPDRAFGEPPPAPPTRRSCWPWWGNWRGLVARTEAPAPAAPAAV